MEREKERESESGRETERERERKRRERESDKERETCKTHFDLNQEKHKCVRPKSKQARAQRVNEENCKPTLSLNTSCNVASKRGLLPRSAGALPLPTWKCNARARLENSHFDN